MFEQIIIYYIEILLTPLHPVHHSKLPPPPPEHTDWAVQCSVVCWHILTVHTCAAVKWRRRQPDTANKYSDCDEPGINYQGSRHRLTAEHLEIG